MSPQLNMLIEWSNALHDDCQYGESSATLSSPLQLGDSIPGIGRSNMPLRSVYAPNKGGKKSQKTLRDM